MIKLEFCFVGGQHVYTSVAVCDQQYALHSQIVFVPPRKPVSSQVYSINPMHGVIAIANRKYQNNIHDYHLVKNMNSALKK